MDYLVPPFLILGVRHGRKMIYSFRKQIKKTTNKRKIRVQVFKS